MQPNDSTDLCLFARPTVRPAAPRSRVLRTRSGFTLLEVMIATAVTLLMMVALAQIFKVIGDSMKQGRAALELNNNLRSVVYRIRGDLENLTAVPHPPSNPAAGMGYLKVFDGGLTDYSVTINDPTQSRYGDVDDILMGTARAGDVWYTGKVPLFVLKKTTPDLTTDNDGNNIPDDLESVVIAAQHAEIAIYCQPVVANSKASFSYDNPSRDPGYLVESPGFFKDDNGDGFPDEFRLHYRALLIRPDLNMDTGLLPANNPIFIAAPQSPTLPTGTQFDAPTPLCDMASIHGRCDLSMRRVFNPSDGLTDATRGPRDYIAANSLQDLVDPANRFAHVQIPIPGTASTTMPVLALGPKLTVGNITNADPDGNWGTSNFKVGTGFLHPAFTLHGARAGEDILAANILAFDIKVYDPGDP
ncbi:MAG: prepilin-type N-terminal cleavage/methylation domain-containing protein, partial [Planctomycetales bacterium]|nr:prepilin-type N-terminal cleavage/methylation domain-containing protein [Planctomycetales bacterium]